MKTQHRRRDEETDQEEKKDFILPECDQTNMFRGGRETHTDDFTARTCRKRRSYWYFYPSK